MRSSIASSKTLILEEGLTATHSMNNTTVYAKQHKHIRKHMNGIPTILDHGALLFRKKNISAKMSSTSTVARRTNEAYAFSLVLLFCFLFSVLIYICFVVRLL